MAAPDMVLLHYTAMDTAEAALNRLCDPEYEVSAHYLISETGFVWQMVDEVKRAWHAGAGRWGNVSDVNSHSIGIELANTGFHPFPEPQMVALENLLDQIMTRWSIPAHRVVAHSDTAPGRKVDPGKRFDWRRLARAGRAVWSDALGDAEVDLSDALTRIGYDPDLPFETRLAAFRLRFNPTATGPAQPSDRARAADIAHRFAVDGARPLT